MLTRKSLAAAGALVLAGGLGACGSGGGSGAPTAASKSAFCRTLAGAGKVREPRRLATDLARVGTPGNISAGARRGFEVLVDRLGKLPAHADKGDLTYMSKSLTGSDRSDVVAFITYYSTECKGLPTGFSS